jgi:adenylate cyclase
MKPRLPITVHISTLFILVILIVASTISIFNYKSISQILENIAKDKSELITESVFSHFRSLLTPAENATKLLAYSAITEATNLNDRIKRASLLKAALDNADSFAAIYIGYENGDFFLLRPLGSPEAHTKYNAPPQTEYMIQSIEHQGQDLIGSYIFLDANLHTLKIEKQAEYPKKYFPKQRPWYQTAFNAASVIATDPYLFFASRKVGITIANKTSNQKAVVAIDIELDSLSKNLNSQKITENTEFAIVNNQGHVIGTNSDESLIFQQGSNSNDLKLKTLKDFQPPIYAKLDDIFSQFTNRDNFHEVLLLDNERWKVDINRFLIGAENTIYFVSATPEKDLLAGAIAIRNNSALIVLAITVLIIPFALLIARSIAKPIKKLANTADNIRELRLVDSVEINSYITEISSLAKALDRLQKTVSAFTSYIPRDLVRDLLKSESGIGIGGESRYLTVLFSDLKDFSTISETTPTRELLLRVSSYLELMTYAIKEEGGTVDKFIGDSVMAFWGAPLLDKDHAYHAAVAAIKTKRRMVTLNQGLIRENKPPLVVRIGINTDAVLVGNIGSTERLSYTVMGDGVNIASRLEGINKEFGTDIAISHALFKEAGERLWVRPIDQITVKGRKGEILIYELMGTRDGDSETVCSADEKELCLLTVKAFEFYTTQQYESAISVYSEMVDQYEDPLSKAMILKCREKMNSSLS